MFSLFQVFKILLNYVCYHEIWLCYFHKKGIVYGQVYSLANHDQICQVVQILVLQSKQTFTIYVKCWRFHKSIVFKCIYECARNKIYKGINCSTYSIVCMAKQVEIHINSSGMVDLSIYIDKTYWLIILPRSVKLGGYNLSLLGS